MTVRQAEKKPVGVCQQTEKTHEGTFEVTMMMMMMTMGIRVMAVDHLRRM
mgnify:CR=1 FL=1